MTIEELNARLEELKRAIVGPEPRLSVVVSSAKHAENRFAVYAEAETSRQIFKGYGGDLAKLLDQAQEAIDDASPIMLARTLGIEPIESAAQ